MDILVCVAEIIREGLLLFPWQFKVIEDLIMKNTYPIAEAGLETARVMGFNYLENIINIEKELVDLKQSQDIFLQYGLSKDLGNLQIRDELVETLIKAWEVHRGEILRGKIIEATGYWGINSSRAKEFLKKISKEDNTLGKKAKEALKILQDKEEALDKELFYIERKLAEGEVNSPHPLLFHLLGGLWTVYGFEKARDILLAMDGDKSFHSYSEGILSNLRFRPDERVFVRLDAHLRNSYDILKQTLSLNILLEPWWLENNPTVQAVLKDFLERLSQEKILDYLELKMALVTAQVLFLYRNGEEKTEIALLCLELLNKFPPRPDEETMKLYHQIIWMLGEHLRLPVRMSKMQSLEFSCENFVLRRIRGSVLNLQTIVEGVRRFSKSEDKMVRASAAGALIGLGEVKEGKVILEGLSNDADPWVQFMVAKTYLDLSDFRKKGTDILDRLGQSFSSAELLFRVAWEWYRLDNLDKAEQTLFWLMQRFPSLSPELTQGIATLQLRIEVRDELKQLLEQLNSIALPEYKLDKAKKIWEKLSSVT
ncbi:MAG: hypothetical protein NC821_06320, partial [Candidatus Omnitrophica bacterium]|nr:hypothetical protein [Candidatus Omnitrophota bacterium]